MTTAVAAAMLVVSTATIDDLLDAIEVVESGGNPNVVGDGGRSFGPLQIQRGYWLDAGGSGRFERVRERDYARRIVRAYWRRYCPKALKRGDLETLARVHNGGPAGAKKAATVPYWKKVRGVMESKANVSNARQRQR